jgi:hypothetical protein
LILLKFLWKNPNARTTVRAYLLVFIIHRAHTVRKGDSARINANTPDHAVISKDAPCAPLLIYRIWVVGPHGRAGIGNGGTIFECYFIKAEGNETVTNCHGLKMPAVDGKMRMSNIADTEQLFRLIQSIPSPKAEPFKLWLAQVAAERLDEMQDPELSIDRAMEQYLQLGYSENFRKNVNVFGKMGYIWRKLKKKTSKTEGRHIICSLELKTNCTNFETIK